MTAHTPVQAPSPTGVLGAPPHDLGPEIAAAVDAEPARRRGTLEMVAGGVATALLPGSGDTVAAAPGRRVRTLTDRFPLHSADPRPVVQEAGQ